MTAITKHDISMVWGKINLYGSHSMDSKLIACEGIARLPREVQERILDECIFLIVDKDTGGELIGVPICRYVWKPEHKDEKVHEIQPIIPLNFLDVKGYVERTRASKINTVMHECAHFVRGHHLKENYPGSHAEMEKEADKLVVEWGGYPSYDDYGSINHIPEEKFSYHIIRIPQYLKQRLLNIGDRKLTEYLAKQAHFLEYEA